VSSVSKVVGDRMGSPPSAKMRLATSRRMKVPVWRTAYLRAGILILILGLWPSPGPGPNSQTNGITIRFWLPGGQKTDPYPLCLVAGAGARGGPEPRDTDKEAPGSDYFETVSIKIRPKSGPEARFPARRLHCITYGTY
jgi:hypothetical protein